MRAARRRPASAAPRPVDRTRHRGTGHVRARRGTSDARRAGGERVAHEAVRRRSVRPAGRRRARRAPASRESIDDGRDLDVRADEDSPSTARATSVSAPRSHARPPQRLELLAGHDHDRRTGRSRRRTPASVSWPFPAMTTTSPGAGLAQGQPDRRPPVGLDHVARRRPRGAGLDLRDDRERVLRARVVARDDRQVRRPRWPPAPSGDASRGRDRRRTRTRRSAGRTPAGAPRAARVGCCPACARSPRAPGSPARPRRLHPARHPSRRPRCPAPMASSSMPSAARPRPPPPGSSSTLKAPRSGERTAGRPTANEMPDRVTRDVGGPQVGARRRRRTSTVGDRAPRAADAPRGSSRFTTARAASSGVNSRALAAKYASIVAW